MTISIRRMTLGSGYRYLMESVAAGDGRAGTASPLVRYYAESGTPPGRFIGRGLADLDHGRGVAVGAVVTEEHLFNLLGMCADPITGMPLGRRPVREPRPLAERVAQRLATLGELSEVEREAARTVIEAEERARELHLARPVAGFDLTFSPSKSVSIAWALGDEVTRTTIYEAHLEAIAITLAYAEEHVFSSRSGAGGIVEEDITGVIGAVFDHWDSRAGDPQLHSHVVVANRGRSVSDGAWRTLDSRKLFGSVVALSELHQGVLEDLLAARLGVTFDARERLHSAAPRWEVAGIPEPLIAEFSTRAAAIEAEKERLVASFRAAHGREPGSTEVLRLRQQATLTTRPEKQHRSLEQLSASWHRRARPHVGADPEAFVASLPRRGGPRLPALGDAALVRLGDQALAAVSERRATFSEANVSAEVHRLLQDRVFADPAVRIAAGARAVELALGRAVPVSGPETLHVPAMLRREDGTSRLSSRAARRYTSAELLEAEARLSDAGRDRRGPSVAPAVVDAAVTLLPRQLGVDQLLAIEQVATSGHVLDLLVGPAGSGKSATLGALRRVWEAANGAGSVLGLAPSASAAQLLGDELQIATENTAKWLAEHRRRPDRERMIAELRTALASVETASAATGDLSTRLHQVEAELASWSLRPGQLVLVDEATLAATRDLDELVAAARDAGAKILLVGDPHQLSAVGAGGAFSMLVGERTDVAELHEVRRFAEDWEAKASLLLRAGDESAIAAYVDHGRVIDGGREEMLDAVFSAWRADIAAGRRAVMIAADHNSVAALNERARAARVTAGEVRADGVAIAGGSAAGVGDRVVTRENDRRLLAGLHWVRNGDEWVVTETNPDGSLRVRRAHGPGEVLLPGDYAASHVELAYARTSFGVQGATVDVAHALVSAGTTREALYVSTTRGRAANHLYVDVTDDPDPDTSHGAPERAPAVEALRRVLRTSGAEVAGSVAITFERDRFESIARLALEYQTIAQLAQGPRWRRALEGCGLPEIAIEEVVASPSYGALATALREADACGLDVEATLPSLVAARPLGDADDLAAVLHSRVRRWIEVAAPRSARSSDYVVGLLPAARGVTDEDLVRALEERAVAMEARADALVVRAVRSREPWIVPLGPSPVERGRRGAWLRAARTLASYRDRWSIPGSETVGLDAIGSEEQKRHAALALRAILGAARAARASLSTSSPSRGDGVAIRAAGEEIDL